MSSKNTFVPTVFYFQKFYAILLYFSDISMAKVRLVLNYRNFQIYSKAYERKIFSVMFSFGGIISFY